MKVSWLVVGAVLIACLSSAAAQGPARFEVASIRENTTIGGPGVESGADITPTGYYARRESLFNLISFAYGIPDIDARSRIDYSKVGASVLRRTFDINARGQGNTRAMLRTLLAERFGLRMHTETREVSTWALMVKDRKRLTPSRYNCFAHLGTGKRFDAALSPKDECRNLIARSMRDVVTHKAHGTMEDFTQAVARAVLLQPVVNRTGLQGNFAWDFSLQRPVERAALPAAMNQALQDQLGLKLERVKGPQEVLVIDAVQMPTPN